MLMIDKRRETTDRRKTPTRPISRYSFRGRRKKNRRIDESKNYYVDRYEPKYLIIVFIILVFCTADALLTLKLLQHGGVEMNPFMAFLIKKDPDLFLITKFLITAINVTILLIHKNFQVFYKLNIRYIIYAVFSLYFGLIVYEIFLYIRFLT